MFVGFGVLMASCYAVAFWLSRPATDPGFELVGEEFYAGFNAADAASMEVVALDRETGDLKKFQVENRDGLWVISSHFNYPAEAAQRLADTTTALMGLKRDALQGRLESEQKLYEVCDPRSSKALPDECGTRVTVRDAAGEVLVDYIIGKQVESRDTVSLERTGQQQVPYFYVRKPNEPQTFKVEMDVDLSARFVDWIQQDVLGLDGNKVSSLVIDNYSIEESREGGRLRSRFIPGDSIELAKVGMDWQLTGLESEVEELDSGKVTELLAAINGMQITGVRPKLEFNGRAVALLNGDLTLNSDEFANVSESNKTQVLLSVADRLRDQGFFLDPGADNPDQRLFSTRGKVQVGTEDGVRYTIYFGDVVIGDENAIELGIGELTKAKEGPEANGGGEAADNANSSEENQGGDRNRFVLVRAVVDSALLGDLPPEPVSPVRPEEPADYMPVAEYEQKYSGEDAPPKPPEFAETLEKFRVFEEALASYGEDLAGYEAEIERLEGLRKQRQEKLDAASTLVEELNFRFGPWYYLVEASELESMRIARSELVTAVEPAGGDDAGPMPGIPNIEFPGREELDPAGGPGEGGPDPSADSDSDNGSGLPL